MKQIYNLSVTKRKIGHILSYLHHCTGHVSNTGTVAIMMPIVISMAAVANLNIRRYLMPLAFASGMGIFTLISTPPNMVVQESLVNNGYDPLAFFSFAPIGCIAVIVGIVVLFFSSKSLKPLKKDKDESKQGKTLAELVGFCAARTCCANKVIAQHVSLFYINYLLPIGTYEIVSRTFL